MNVADSQVIDIGFAGVVGADRIGDGEERLRRRVHAADRSRRLLRARQLPALRAVRAGPPLGRRPRGAPRGARRRDPLRPRSSAGLLLLAGRRLREGAEGRALGVALAFAWLAYPYTLYALNANGGNDALVAALLVAALIVVASPLKRGPGDRARRRGQVRPARARPAVRGRHRRAALALDGDLRRRLRRRLGGRPAAAAARAAASASSTTGPSATRRRAARRSASGASSPRWSRCRRWRGRCPVLLGLALFFVPAPAHAAAGRGARRRGPDRHPGRLRALVLLLHPLVDALRADRRLRARRSGSRSAGDVDLAPSRSS